MKPDELCWIYVTASDRGEALKLAEAVVGERLAACANVIDGMESVYWWEGAMAREKEAVLILKTRASLVEALTARVRALHSYTVPCVVALPILGGNPAYMDWLRAETAPPAAE